MKVLVSYDRHPSQWLLDPYESNSACVQRNRPWMFAGLHEEYFEESGSPLAIGWKLMMNSFEAIAP
jgi:hypothetical protein